MLVSNTRSFIIIIIFTFSTFSKTCAYSRKNLIITFQFYFVFLRQEVSVITSERCCPNGWVLSLFQLVSVLLKSNSADGTLSKCYSFCVGVLPFLVLIYLNWAIYVELKKLQVREISIKLNICQSTPRKKVLRKAEQLSEVCLKALIFLTLERRLCLRYYICTLHVWHSNDAFETINFVMFDFMIVA